MKKIKNYFIYLLLASGMVFITSCEEKMEEFVGEPEPEGESSTEDLFVNVTEMDKIMNGAYSIVIGFAGNGLGTAVYTLPEWTADFVAVYPPNYSSAAFLDLYQRKNSSLNWADHTRVLQYASNAENIANRIIEELESDEHKGDPAYEVTGKRMLGEAYVMRAMINFEYTKFFGKQYHSSTLNDKAWLYRKSFISSLESARDARETVGDSYKFLIEDLERALELLPLEYDPAIHNARYGTNRFNKDVARASLAKVYFQMNDFENAKKYIDELLGPSPGQPAYYPLAQYNSDVPDEGYPAVTHWRFDTEWYGRSRGWEVIFAFEGDNGTHATRSDKNTRWIKFVPENDPRSRSDITNAQGQYTMSDYFIDYTDFDTINDVRYLELFDNLLMPDGNNYWWPLKFAMMGDKGNNIIWFRSAEFILMRAECNARAGNDADAIADLNAIRNRAGIGNYEGSRDDTGNLLQDIIKERAREMHLEKYRLWELLRLGSIDGTKIGNGDRLEKPADLNGIDASFYGGRELEWNDDLWKFPVPTNESLYNPDALK
jgi:starch-binding outer membrane protein, SusD/RagB family